MAKGIQIKRALAKSWATKFAGYVLAPGEMGLEKDTGRIKFGDGVRKWSELLYSDSTEIVDDLDVITAENQEAYVNKAASAKVVKNLEKRIKTLEKTHGGEIGGIDCGVIE